MNGKRLYLIAAITVAVAMALIIPVYAYTSSVSVSDNTVSSTSRTIDIEDQTEPFSVTPPAYADVSTPVSIGVHTFQLVADDDVEMRAWIYLNDLRDWLILDHAELKIYNETTDLNVLNDGDVQKYVLDNGTFAEVDQGDVDPGSGTHYYVAAYDVNFGEEHGSGDTYQALVPTPSMTLDPAIEYKFEVVFHFKGLVGPTLYGQYAADFSGTITFAIADSDPVPPIPNP